MVKEKLPGAAGAPVKLPEASTANPDGAPALTMDQTYGGRPPEAVTACEYAEPMTAAGSAAEDVMVKPLAAICMEQDRLILFPPVSAACSTYVDMPVCPGVPEMSACAASSANPFGSAPDGMVHVYRSEE